MKSISTFVTIGCILLVLALSAGVYVWFEFQKYQKELRNPTPISSEEIPSTEPKNVVQ